jgi:ABC-type dipeptide/oligopeptide/nickel transport system permease component
MIVAVFTIIGFLTMIGYLVADVLYAVVDPRISYK